MAKKRYSIALPLFILLAGGGAASWLVANPQNITTADLEPEQVKEVLPQVLTTELKPSQKSLIQVVYGQVEATHQRQVSAPVAGELTQVLVSVGEVVTEGQVMARIDVDRLLKEQRQLNNRIADLNLQLEQEALRQQAAQSNFALEQELLTIATSNLRRAEELAAKGLASASELENAQRNVQQQKLSFARIEQELKLFSPVVSRLRLSLDEQKQLLQDVVSDIEKAEIKAPIDGVVTEANVLAGEVVNSGRVLFNLQDQDNLEVKAWLPEQTLAEGIGAARLVWGNRTLDAELTRLSPSVNQGVVAAWYRITGQEALLREGAIVELQLQQQWQQSGYSVPESAVYEGERVYLVDDGRLISHQVKKLGYVLDQGEWKAHVMFEQQPAAEPALLISRLPDVFSGMRVEVRN